MSKNSEISSSGSCSSSSDSQQSEEDHYVFDNTECMMIGIDFEKSKGRNNLELTLPYLIKIRSGQYNDCREELNSR